MIGSRASDISSSQMSESSVLFKWAGLSRKARAVLCVHGEKGRWTYGKEQHPHKGPILQKPRQGCFRTLQRLGWRSNGVQQGLNVLACPVARTKKKAAKAPLISIQRHLSQHPRLSWGPQQTLSAQDCFSATRGGNGSFSKQATETWTPRPGEEDGAQEEVWKRRWRSPGIYS